MTQKVTQRTCRPHDHSTCTQPWLTHQRDSERGPQLHIRIRPREHTRPTWAVADHARHHDAHGHISVSDTHAEASLPANEQVLSCGAMVRVKVSWLAVHRIVTHACQNDVRELPPQVEREVHDREQRKPKAHGLFVDPRAHAIRRECEQQVVLTGEEVRIAATQLRTGG